MFDELHVYHDNEQRSAPLNMAIDEALLESATSPTLRFYGWKRPSLSFGYFGKYQDAAIAGENRDLVRRWTGGGIVFHGADLTYSIIIPNHDARFADASMSIYASVHDSLRHALVTSGHRAELAAVAGVADGGAMVDPESVRGGYKKDQCFANPVRADVMINGQKIAGAAQRRTRRGLLQQGSIQHVDLAEDFEMQFADALSDNCKPRDFNDFILGRADELAAQKYGAKSWLQKR